MPNDCMTKEELYNFAIGAVDGRTVGINFNKHELMWLTGVYWIESVSGDGDMFFVKARHVLGGVSNFNGDDICQMHYA